MPPTAPATHPEAPAPFRPPAQLRATSGAVRPFPDAVKFGC